jgi:MFS family permease
VKHTAPQPPTPPPPLPVTALITVLTFVDRSNLGLAAPVLLHDVSLTRPQYGLAASVFFVSYGLCMAPSAFLFTALGLRAWMTAIVILWGAVTAATAAVRGFRSLVALRVLLGAAEAGTMPGCWFLLSRFVPADTLAYAYSWTLTFTVLAQVIGAPIGAAFLGPMQGVAGLAGWRWMFIAEGAGTAVIGLLLPFAMADTVGACRWLTPADKRALADALHASAAAVGAPLPDVGPVPDATGAPPAPAAPEPVVTSLRAAARVMRVWQVWALGVAVMLVQVAFFGVLYFTPLLISSAFGAADPVYEGPAAEAHKAMVAALKSVVVFGPAAAAMVAAGAWTRRTGDRKWASFACLTASAVSFGLVPAAARSGGGGRRARRAHRGRGGRVRHPVPAHHVAAPLHRGGWSARGGGVRVLELVCGGRRRRGAICVRRDGKRSVCPAGGVSGRRRRPVAGVWVLGG